MKKPNKKVPGPLFSVLIVVILAAVSATTVSLFAKEKQDVASSGMTEVADVQRRQGENEIIDERIEACFVQEPYSTPEEEPPREQAPAGPRRYDGDGPYTEFKITAGPEIYDDACFIYYLVDDSYYEIAGRYRPIFTDIVIPSELFGLPVKGIRDRAFFDFDYLTSVVIPDSIEYIGDDAFSACGKLTNVVLPDKDIRIGDSAFG